MRKAKLFVLVLAALGLMAARAGAQDLTVRNYLNAGIGIGSFAYAGTGGLPLTASFEHDLTGTFSAGVLAGFVRTKGYPEARYTNYLLGARGSYHFNGLLNVYNPRLDIYGGGSLFYRGYKANYSNYDGATSRGTGGGGLDFALHAGTRYLFAGSAGAFAELGFGIVPLQVGVSFAF